MGEQANESDTVWVYSHRWPGDRAFPPIISEDIGKSSLKRIAEKRTASDHQIGDSLWLRAENKLHRKCFHRKPSEMDAEGRVCPEEAFSVTIYGLQRASLQSQKALS